MRTFIALSLCALIAACSHQQTMNKASVGTVAMQTTYPTTYPTTLPTTAPTTYATTYATVLPTTAATDLPPTPSPAPTASALWQIGGPYVVANTNQCGAPTFPTPTSADFVLIQNDSYCGRNQLNPVGNGGSGVYLLNNGQTYTWNFVTVTHMGIDGHLTQRLVWQIHDYACGGSPKTVLGISTGFDNTNVQKWYLQSGNGVTYVPYVEGATDTWKIVVTISLSSTTGHFTAYHNGTKVDDGAGPTYVCGTKPWWNIGPYMWDWTNHNAPSNLSRVEILFSSLTLN